MKEIKRILVITAWYPSKQQPVAAVFVRDQIQILNHYFNNSEADCSYKFCVLHINYPIDMIGFLFKNKKPERYITSDIIEKFSVIHQQGLIFSHRINIFNKFFEGFSINRGWEHAIKSLGGIPDTILAVTLSGLITATEFIRRKKLNIPIYLQEHSVPLSMHFKNENRKNRAISALKSVQKIIVVAKRQIDEFNNLINDLPITIIPNPARQEYFETEINSNINTSDFKIVTVGHLNNQKAQDKLILAFSLLLNSKIRMNLNLYIIGDGENRKTLEELVKRLKLEQYIIFTGALNSLQIIEILKNANLFVLSSKYENCPVALIEAQAMGLPCVCTINNGSEYILLEGNGKSVIQDETGENIAAGLSEMIININNYNKIDIRKRAYNLYSPKIFADKFLELMNFHLSKKLTLI